MAYADEVAAVQEPQPDGPTTVAYWTKEFAAADKWFKNYHALAKRVEESYLIEGKDTDQTNDTQDPSKYNLFWSNVQVMLAAMYGRMPKVEVDRTNLDPDDDVARVGGMILERIFNSEFANVEDSPYYIYQECIQDRFVAGMGIAWARYDFKEGTQTVPAPVIEDQAPGEPVEIPIITDEAAPIDYVNWHDFRYSPCKRWQDKRWVARLLPMSKQEVEEQWGKEKADAIPYNLKSARGASNEDPLKAQVEAQAEIWEIWCIKERHAYWYVPGYTDLLDMKEDPLKLAGFWPMRRPLFATMLSRKCLPRPDFKYAQSQYAELNLVVQRCKLLTEALKVVGIYDKTQDAIKRLVSQANLNELIPVDNWAMLAEKGGIKGVVDWFPLEMVINTLEKLHLRKAALVAEVYEVLGISDIQRGMATSRETATTQKLKAQFGTARTDTKQNEIARFITEHTRLRAEIICLHWQPQTIIDRSQIMMTGEKPELVQQAVAALKKDPSMLLTRITVAADTIAAPDWDLEKQQRIDFLQAISQFIGMAMPIIDKDPSVGPYIVRIMQWAATGFKGAKQIEGVLDQAYQAMLANLEAKKGKPKEPSAEDKQKLAQAKKAEAEARGKNIENALAVFGIDFDMPGVREAIIASLMIPPPEAAGPAALPAPQVGAQAPKPAIAPSTPRPQVS